MMMRATHSIRTIATYMGRIPSTVSRELIRHIVVPVKGHDASLVGYRTGLTRHRSRRSPKLHPDGEHVGVVVYHPRKNWLPRQITRSLKRVFPGNLCRQVSHETTYNPLYVIPCGSLKKEPIAYLRQGNGKRRPLSRDKDRRQHIPELVSLHTRTPEVGDRLMLGHWEGDLVIGANHRAALGMSVECTTRFVIQEKVDGTTATLATVGFCDKLNEVLRALRLSMTYDQGREMMKHPEIAQKTGTAMYFADPHSPWQQGYNENTNGLLRAVPAEGNRPLSLQPERGRRLNEHTAAQDTAPATPLEVYREVHRNCSLARARFNSVALAS
nr:IS30 family transposase [Halomonas alimentaria]